jgi:hypothetical protein
MEADQLQDTNAACTAIGSPAGLSGERGSGLSRDCAV